MELNDSLPPVPDFEAAWKEAENACKEWGKRTCRDAADYNRLLKGLGEGAFQSAGIDEYDKEDEDYDCEP